MRYVVRISTAGRPARLNSWSLPRSLTHPFPLSLSLSLSCLPVLGTSRGNAKITEIVERLRLWGVTQLYVIGGNGGNAAAHAIAQECMSQKVTCSVVGVPKSIDNDIQIIDRCFGFDTAVEEAQRSLICARVEARSAGGISVVKLMGRQSGACCCFRSRGGDRRVG